MIEQNAVGRVQTIGLAVIHRDPVSVKLGDRVGRARVKGRGFGLRRFHGRAVHFRGGCLAEPRLSLQARNPDGFQEPQRAQRIRIGGVLGRLEAHLDMALGRQIVDLVRCRFLDDTNEVRRIRHVAMVQDQITMRRMRVLVDVFDAGGVEERGTPLDTVDRVAFRQQQTDQIRSRPAPSHRLPVQFFARPCTQLATEQNTSGRLNPRFRQEAQEEPAGMPLF